MYDALRASFFFFRSDVTIGHGGERGARGGGVLSVEGDGQQRVGGIGQKHVQRDVIRPEHEVEVVKGDARKQITAVLLGDGVHNGGVGKVLVSLFVDHTDHVGKRGISLLVFLGVMAQILAHRKLEKPRPVDVVHVGHLQVSHFVRRGVLRVEVIKLGAVCTLFSRRERGEILRHGKREARGGKVTSAERRKEKLA